MTDATDTTAVIERHLGAFLRGDLTALVADYAETATLMTPDATHTGPDQIAAFFTEMLADGFAPGTYELTLDVLRSEGDVAYIVWHATCREYEVPLATDTFVLEGGRIVRQTFASIRRSGRAAGAQIGV